MTAGSAPAGRRSLSGRLADLGPRRWWQILVATTLAFTGFFGGLDRVDTTVTRLQPGVQYDDGALTVTVKRATLVPTVTAGEKVLMNAEPGSQFLAVAATMANNGSQPVPLAGEIDLRGVEPTGSATIFRLADGSQTASLGPGLSDDFGYVWQVPLTALRDGDTVTLRIWNKQYVELSVALGKGWIDSPTDYAEVELPVGARR